METQDRVRETHKLNRSIRLYIMYGGGGNNNYHIVVWFGWPTEPKQDVLYLHSASPSLTSPSSPMMSPHFIWQRPITGLGTSSTSNETACVHCVVVWICCLCRPDWHSLSVWLLKRLDSAHFCVLCEDTGKPLTCQADFWNWKKNQKANHCSHGLTDM